jgi:hypothetical protein
MVQTESMQPYPLWSTPNIVMPIAFLCAGVLNEQVWNCQLHLQAGGRLQTETRYAMPPTWLSSPRWAVWEGSEKALPIHAVDLAQRENRSIPTPPRATTKLFD